MILVRGTRNPSLGAVELTVALEACLDLPRDRIVWDTGHQAYVHKVLTGRRDALWTIRQKDGISGFLKREESPYDAFGAGMPEHSTAEGTFRVAEDGWIEWTINRPMPEVVVRVGRVANHTLHLQGREIPLAALFLPGTAVALRSRTYSEFDLWKERCLR